MAISLRKGGDVSLTGEAGGTLTAITVGLGWDARTATGAPFDLDAWTLMCTATGKVASDLHVIFYNNLSSPDGSTVHQGDNLTGAGSDDDEQVKVCLADVPADIDRIVFPVSIHDAETRDQRFGQVRNAFIRVVDDATGTELARYDLSEDASTESAMVFGEVYRHGAEWRFRAIGRGCTSGLHGLAGDYGFDVG